MDNITLATINAALSAHPYFSAAIHFIFCACLGSYFNLFAWRWPQIQERNWLADVRGWFKDKGWPEPQAQLDIPDNLGLSLPRSFCPSCKTPISPLYNIPILGWLLLRGKSACCKTSISIAYPGYELFCGLLGAFAWMHFQEAGAAWMFLLLALPLCMASQTDFESMMLPDGITFFILFSGLGLSIFYPTFPLDAKMAFAGMAASFIVLATIRVVGSAAFKREAMGQGDPKLFAAIGAWIGPYSIPQALVFAALSALIYGLVMKILGKHKNGSPVPFGPFLALGGAASFVWPQALARLLG